MQYTMYIIHVFSLTGWKNCFMKMVLPIKIIVTFLFLRKTVSFFLIKLSVLLQMYLILWIFINGRFSLYTLGVNGEQLK